ncbi:hypothetical protein Cni_G29155 [Canna indica]|uniref:Uncharacterized protein n=1 Tax=Canna indica TaxID=4628 RepID=A0AAQ3L4T4_9LILI|nr:hypothetical protein Cni_G29155 [Canna indica]
MDMEENSRHMSSNEFCFKAKEAIGEGKKVEEELDIKGNNLEELTMKMTDSFVKNLENEFAKEDFLEEWIDPKQSRVASRCGVKGRKSLLKTENLVNIPIGYKHIKMKKRRCSKDINAMGNEGDPAEQEGVEKSKTL